MHDYNGSKSSDGFRERASILLPWARVMTICTGGYSCAVQKSLTIPTNTHTHARAHVSVLAHTHNGRKEQKLYTAKCFFYDLNYVQHYPLACVPFRSVLSAGLVRYCWHSCCMKEDWTLSHIKRITNRKRSLLGPTQTTTVALFTSKSTYPVGAYDTETWLIMNILQIDMLLIALAFYRYYP